MVGGDVVRGHFAGAVLLLATMVFLASCGDVTKATSGVYGITLVNHGGLMTAAPSPSPLPGGFLASSYWVPDSREVVLIKAVDGEHAGQVVARVHSDNRGLFRVELPPGRYVLSEKRWPLIEKRVTVHAGRFSRVLIQVAYLN
jgi:hypothetical protein